MAEPAHSLPRDTAASDRIGAAFGTGAPDDFGARRKLIVDTLRDTLAEGRAALAAAFDGQPRSARAMVTGYAALIDTVVLAAFDAARRYLVGPDTTAAPGVADLALLAVGGYGRAEMAPQSDVDLLFLASSDITPEAEQVIEATLYTLWDLHLKVGHASRTIRDCLRLAREDFTIRTALLELRFLTGDPQPAAHLRHRLRNELFDNTTAEFIEAKLVERDQRHLKQGGQRYMVEPNVKEGKGGLRDLQTLYWIAKYTKGVEEVADLVGEGVLTADELANFQRAEAFLMAVRCHLHLLTGRAVDQLTFDMQIEVARAMGFADRSGRRGVEHFMQEYFRHATQVGDLTRIVLTGLEARHVKRAPSLVGLFRRRKRVKRAYKVVHNRLDIADPESFLKDGLNLLRIFEEALRTGYLIHPDAMRLIGANLHLINDDIRRDPKAAALFLDLLLEHGNPERALRRMNELGVLAAFVPEFEPILAMMQFSMYHDYTVDEHTIQCVSILAQIEREELQEELPVASQILREGVKRRILYVGLLLHDIGKGRDEDHSILGARITRKVAPRLGLDEKEAEIAEWLVRYHLLMSDMAQKRDISDPRTVRAFAKAVRTRERLDLLTVLTVCDIRGVGPGTWNNWKAQLLRSLYRDTADALENGMEAINVEHQADEARKALRVALKGWKDDRIDHELDRHYPPYWQGLPSSAHVLFAKMLKGLADDEIRMDLKPDEDHDATRASFAMADHPGIFGRIAGALALVGANVVDARTYTSRDGFATAVFWLQDRDGQPYEASRLRRLKSMIDKTLKGEVVARDALGPKDKVKKRERGFRVPTAISFDNEGSEIYTIIEVDTRDRPALLYDLTRALGAANVTISSAVIATYGAQVVDSFYVKDMFGLKVHSVAKQRGLEKRLRAAIEAGAERALA